MLSRTDFSFLGGRALQFQPAKQLCIRSHDDGGEAHCDRTDAHGQIESPSDEEACCDRNGDNVIGTKTTVPRIGAIKFEPGKEGALYPSQCWTSVDQKTTGIVRAKLNQNLTRNLATECPA